MNISARTMRWIAACALIAGALMIAARLLQLMSGSESSPPGAGVLPVAFLAVAGVLGLYAQNRDTGKCGSVGLMMMLFGWAGVAISTIAFMAGSQFALWYLLINLGLVVFVPVAFILLGVGLPKPFGHAYLVVGCYLIGQMLGRTVLDTAFPPAAFLFSNEAATIVMGIGLMAIGYSVYAGTRPESVVGG